MGASFAEVLSDVLAREGVGCGTHGAAAPFARAVDGCEARVAEASVAMLATEGPMWARVLRVSPLASEAELRQAFRRRAFDVHPDRGGSVEAFVAVQQALEEGLTSLGARPTPPQSARRGGYASAPRRAPGVGVTA
jgi:hypothetical protein